MPCTKARADLCIDGELRKRLAELCRPEPLGTCLRRVLEEAARDERVFAMLRHGEAVRVVEENAQRIAQALAAALAPLLQHLPPGSTVNIGAVNIESIVRNVVNEVKESIINELNTVYVGKALVKIELSAAERAELRELLKLISDVLLNIIYSGGDDTAASKLVSMDVLERYYRKLLDLSRRVERRLGARMEDIARSKSRDAPYADVVISTLRTLENLIHIRKEGSAEERVKMYRQVKPTVVELLNQIRHVMTTYVN